MEDSSEVRMLINTLGNGTFDSVKLEGTFIDTGSARCNVLDQFVVLTGGVMNHAGSAKMYDIEKNTW